ncbi:ferredoxin-thioredoxin reductase catalytic domain-containing protein [Methanococcoides burtonii]|uniref:Ferredoxin thioredoxin reductase-related protein n=1 Tax=Methanococcoides burtonii (strain DSM 6242 / NBRC 107633 / OCM 468 / ACE-M) TaxID=259564 RepID=Q12YZ6_METBU|nr:Ferredoxin thioredoxin reductase-related protein [Methanococcoides burtonii DSM 6242]
MGLESFIGSVFGRSNQGEVTGPVIVELNTNLFLINTFAFEAEVEHSNLPVVVDCFTKTCPPCKKMGQVFEKVASEYESKVKFIKIDLKASPAIGKRFNILGVPTLLFFKDGNLQNNVVGFTNEDKFREHLDNLLEQLSGNSPSEVINMTDNESTKEDMHAWTAKYADKAGYMLNPDEESLHLVLEGLARNRNKHGKNYCPCRIVTGDEQEDKKIICPCIYHKDEINDGGSCHCDLFFKKKD